MEANRQFRKAQDFISTQLREFTALDGKTGKFKTVPEYPEFAWKDAHHVASAIIAGCDYLVTTDDRLLKFKSNQITILDPIDFIKQVGGNVNE